MSAYDRPGHRTTPRFAAAPDIRRARHRLIAAVSPGDRGLSRVRQRRPVTLTYCQGRLLRRADRALRRSDPDLASMLSIFARLAAAEQMPAQEQLRPRLPWDRRILQWPAAAAVFLVVFAGAGFRSASARGSVSRRSASENRESR